jgi:hypothetical protein
MVIEETVVMDVDEVKKKKIIEVKGNVLIIFTKNKYYIPPKVEPH